MVAPRGYPCASGKKRMGKWSRTGPEADGGERVEGGKEGRRERGREEAR